MIRFQDENHAAIVTRVRDRIRTSSGDPGVIDRFMLNACNFILENPEAFDERCRFSAELIENSFLSHAMGFISDGSSKDFVFACLYRLLVEYEFNSPGRNDYVTSALDLIRFSHADVVSKIDGAAKSQLRYADLFLPAQMLKHLKDSPEIKGIKEFNLAVAQLPELQKGMVDELDKRRLEAEQLKEAVVKYRDAFNFVGLYEGFNSLAKSKLWAARFSVLMLFVLGVAMLSPAALKIYLLIESGEYAKESMAVNVPLLISVGAIELLLLYFYRVVLHNLKSIRGQLVQLDLRRALCQFIQSYAEYASKIKGDDKELLVKFESLIFSGIVADAGSIPSTFDGMDQLLKLVQKIKP